MGKAKPKKLSLARKNARAGYLFSIPFLIGFFVFFLFPILQSILLSFRNVSASEGGLVLEYIGLSNYKKLLFSDPTFIRQYLMQSLKDLAINFPCVLIFSFFIAIILNQNFKGRTFSRILFFLPVIVSSGVIMLVQNNQVQSVMMSSISSSASSVDNGIAQLTDTVMGLVRSIRLDSGIISFVEGAVSRIYDITIASGIQILIYLSGLQTISPSLYEASSIEGASGWENFWKITFPMITPLILVNAVYTIVDSMSGLNNGLVYQVYKTAFERGEYGYGSAMGWFYFVIVGVILAVFIGLASKLVYYEND